MPGWLIFVRDIGLIICWELLLRPEIESRLTKKKEAQE